MLHQKENFDLISPELEKGMFWTKVNIMKNIYITMFRNDRAMRFNEIQFSSGCAEHYTLFQEVLNSLLETGFIERFDDKFLLSGKSRQLYKDATNATSIQL